MHCQVGLRVTWLYWFGQQLELLEDIKEIVIDLDPSDTLIVG